MTRDDIIRMAVECQLVTTANRDGIYMEALERFAKLVAAAERESCAHMILSRNRGDSPRLYRDTLKLCAMLIKRRQNKLTKENENESNC
jgi:hypothetical protein